MAATAAEGRGDSIQALLRTITRDYESSRIHDSPPWNEIRERFRRLAQLVESLDAVRARPTLRVKWSTGAGNRAAVPWLAFLDERETKSTQRGVYPVYLFRTDSSGLYLTLAQGVTDAAKQPQGSRRFMQDRANLLRASLPTLGQRGFVARTDADLRSDGPLPRAYEKSVIAHKFYPQDDVPTDAELSADIAHVLAAYDEYLEAKSAEAPADELARLVEEFRQSTAYPSARDRSHHHVREELAGGLSPEVLDAVVDDPSGFAALGLARLAARGYGSPGSQSQVHRGIIDGGDEGRTKLARTLRYLLYGEDPVAQRLDAVLDDDRWKVFGFGESLAVKALAVVFPQQWIPVFMYEGPRGKRRLLTLPELELDAVPESASPGQKIVQSNERLRDRLAPFFGDDAWGQKSFLYWLLGRHEEASPTLDEPNADLALIHERFAGAMEESGLHFTGGTALMVRSFLAALVTKPFVILSGLSGSGKTQLAMRLGEWFGSDAEEQARHVIIPVRPDWTGPEPLFGYEDALQPRASDGRPAWHVPRALQFMLQAARSSAYPHLLVLDEMNLAHVERYFADFLSAAESRAAVLPNLVQEDGGVWRVDPESDEYIELPRNLFVVGTVNVDETTYMFSPKVLDRANTFEFRVATADLVSDARRPVPIPPGDEALVRGFLALGRDDDRQETVPHPSLEEIVAELRTLHATLALTNDEFGHRVFYEAVRFVSFLAETGLDDPDAALDCVVMQKVLPRIHGSRKRVEPLLKRMLEFAGGTDETDGSPASQQARLPMTASKARRMLDVVRANQYVSFAE
jgi:MoxR-like ATPase